MTNEDLARGVLHSAGFTEDFEDIGCHDYQGTCRWTARNAEGKWGACGYDYGSCELCDQTYNWVESDYLEALQRIDVLDAKPPKCDF